MNDDRFGGRPAGRSSRLRHCVDVPTQTWISPGGIPMELPVIVDLVEINNAGVVNWYFEAAVGLVDGEPALLRMCIESGKHYRLDTLRLQQTFRWNTPVEIVTRLVPQIIETGGDPFDFDYPHEGYPAVTVPRPGHRLTHDFLVDIAREYLTAKPPYAHTLAQRYNVTPRTVVSWIEKARQRGILEGGTKGRKDRTLQT